MSVTNQWVGAVDDSSGWVRAKISSGLLSSDAELWVSENEDMSGESSAGTDSPTSDGMVSIRATGLDPDTTYYFQVEDGDGNRGPTGRFHTHGPVGQPYSYTFAAFACAGSDPDYPGDTGDELAPDRISNHPAFDDMREADPDFVAHLGDATYYNLGQGSSSAGDSTVDNYRRMYDDILLQPRQHELYYRVPIVYCWDDHDYGPNNSDGTHEDKANAAQVYRERVPHYDLAESSGPIYHSFRIGRVLHIVSDARYNADPNGDADTSSKTMLGQAQKDWIDSTLADTDAELLIWHMSRQWMGTSTDSWAVFQEERDELVSIFDNRGFLDRMCIISGDMHALAIDTGDGGNLWGGFPVFQFASIDSQFLGNDSTTEQYDLGGSGGRNRYGVVKVEDQGGTIRVTGTGFTGSDVWKSYTFFTQKPVEATAPLGLDYSKGHISDLFEPTEDDQQLRNDVTVKRDGGSSARARKQTGALSTQSPPDGVGRYDEQITLNLARDDQLPNHAGWLLHLGTVNEPRYPDVTVNLTGNPDLIPDVARVELGDRFTINNPPLGLPPGEIALLAEGYSERLTSQEWEWTVNTSPASAYTVAVVGDETLGRLDAKDSKLAEGINSGATSFDVTTADVVWIDSTGYPKGFPFNILVDGEVMTVTAVSGTSSPQTFTVERSFNGVTKSHGAGARVRLAQPAIIAL